MAKRRRRRRSHLTRLLRRQAEQATKPIRYNLRAICDLIKARQTLGLPPVPTGQS